MVQKLGYQTKKGKKTAEEINAEIAQQKQIADENVQLANGDYPGRVKTPFTIGAKGAVPGTIPEGQTQRTFNSEADYQKIATEKRAGLQQQAIQLQQQEQELLKPIQEQTAPTEIPGQAPQQDKSLLQKGVDFLAGRTIQPLGLSGYNQAKKALENPEQAIKQAGTEALIAGSIGIGGTGLGIISGTTAIASQVGVVAKATAIWKIFSLKTLLTGGVIGAVLRRKAGEADTILSSSMSGMSDVNKALKNGEIDYDLANQLMDEYEANINSAEQSVKTLSQINVGNFLGLKDSLAKYQYARMPTGIPSLRRQLELTNVQGQLAQTRQGVFK